MHGSRSQSGKSCHGDVCAYVMPDPRAAAAAYLHVSNSAALLHQPPITTAKETTTARATERRATDCKGDIETFLVRPPLKEGGKSDRLAKIPFYGSGAVAVARASTVNEPGFRTFSLPNSKWSPETKV